MWRTHRSRILNGSSQQPPSQGVNNRADGCMAPGSGVSNGVSGIPGDLPEYVILPSHAGLCEGGPTLSLATRGINMENNNEKILKAKEFVVKEMSIEKENIDLKEIKVPLKSPKSFDKDTKDSAEKSGQNTSETVASSVNSGANSLEMSDPTKVEQETPEVLEGLKEVGPLATETSFSREADSVESIKVSGTGESSETTGEVLENQGSLKLSEFKNEGGTKKKNRNDVKKKKKRSGQARILRNQRRKIRREQLKALGQESQRNKGKGGILLENKGNLSGKQKNASESRENSSGSQGGLSGSQMNFSSKGSSSQMPQNQTGNKKNSSGNQRTLGKPKALPNNQRRVSKQLPIKTTSTEDQRNLSRNQGNLPRNQGSSTKSGANLTGNHNNLLRNQINQGNRPEVQGSLPATRRILPSMQANLSENLGNLSEIQESRLGNQGNLPRIQENQPQYQENLSGNQDYSSIQESRLGNQGNLPRIQENQPLYHENLSGNQDYPSIQESRLGNQGNLPRIQKNQPLYQENLSGNQDYPSIQESRLGNQGNLPRIQENLSGKQSYPSIQRNLSVLPSTSRTQNYGMDSLNSPRSKKRKINSMAPSPESLQACKRTKYSEKISSSENSHLIRIIISDGFRKVGITREEFGQVRKAISQEIDGIQVGPIPRFNDAYLRFGGIVVESADEWSRDWLTDRVPKLYPWTGARLRVVDLASLEKFHKAILWVPGLVENPEIILRRIEKQNPNLKTGNWKVYSGEEKFTLRGYNLILKIPNSSVKALKEMDFKLFLGLTRVTITVTRTEDPGEGQGFSS